MGDQQKLMVVDDIEDNRELLLDIFEESYQLSEASGGKECLELAGKELPDIILLDVNMPEIDGYEVCRQLKKTPETALIPVVFVSALATQEDRLLGYEVGAEDYVTKPFIDDMVIEVVHKVLQRKQQLLDFEEQNKAAQSAAFQAMASGSELGQIIQFLQRSYTSSSCSSVAKELLETLASFGLNCCVYVQSGYKSEFFNCADDSIESKVLERSFGGERLMDFGSRTLINAEKVSLLVKNMPLDDPDRYGRLKDHLTVLVNGAEARLKVLFAETQVEEQRIAGIQSMLLRSHDELRNIRDLIALQENSVSRIVSSLSQKIESMLFSLGLEEYQEKAIINALDEGINEVETLAELSSKIERSFDDFIKALDELVE